jgi:membrane-associated phospholipid phosphatase
MEICIVAVLAVALGSVQTCAADGNSFARAASDAIVPFLAVGEVALAFDGKNGRQDAVNGAKALVSTCAATELLKYTVREKRPNSSSLTSFPSGHTSAAFAMATVIAAHNPKLEWPAYTVAATIGWSRVEVKAHRWQDVIAGALLGHYVAKQFAKERLSVSSNGLSLSWRW